ncbi:hypothetical protein ADIS_2411 [Lunatimonas lonarensis]|uniref:Luciferase-like monooxygenase n=1 Tax=Lunatimonas lonarensis TaxID=1232681 RepID=R7ZSK0_9BACT|nr:LLM class flavin-dependent oxidoreductase [Lunatimonas lonarensis]EON77101.1 hypothetical protein ADIS_2411 [Lunatimonas lonarensis]
MDPSTPYSILDLAILREGYDARDAYHRTLDLTQQVEQMGFKRFWVAEHHNMANVASSAPTLLMGYLAQGTQHIRIGSGGIMLPNHSPLMVAEQIGFLETLYPGRIDLGLGRAPGTDQRTAAVLRRGRMESIQEFPNDLEDLKSYFSEDNWDAPVRAFPAEGLQVPMFLLGSSLYSAGLAAKKGMPYVFASHFAPSHFSQAAHFYRVNFTPSAENPKPYFIACVNMILAESEERAQFLASSFYQLALGIVRGKSYPLKQPIPEMRAVWTEREEAAVENMLAYSFIGTPKSVRPALERFIAKGYVDELMVSCNMYDHGDSLTSYRLVRNLMLKIRKNAYLLDKP